MRRFRVLLLTVALVAATAGALVVTQQPSRATDPDIIIDAAGDIACVPNTAQGTTSCRHPEVSDVIVADKAAADSAGKTFYFQSLGDNQYDNGLYDEFTGVAGGTGPGGWDPSNAHTSNLGRALSYTHPAPGNHEYQSGNNGAGYYTYFGDAASPQESGCTVGCKGYYSYDAGAWHVVVLNKAWAHGVGSTQYNWLVSDLDSSTKQCTAVAWHEPRYTSLSSSHNDDTTFADVWSTLYAHGVEMVWNGHQHWYERFAPQDDTERYDPEYGIRQFTIGTGGKGNQAVSADGVAMHSEVRSSAANGVVQFTLSDGSYSWNFHPRSGQTLNESGSGTCHGAPGTPTAQVKATAEDGTLNAFASTSNASVQDYKDQGSPAATGVPINKKYYTVNTTSAAGWVKMDSTQVPQSKDCATVRSYLKVNSYTAGESVDLLSIKDTTVNWNSFDMWWSNTTGNLSWNLAAANTDSVAFSSNRWYRVEVQTCYGTSGTYTAQVWLDGVDQGSISSTGQSSADVSYVRWGHDVAKTQSFSVDHAAVSTGDTLPARFNSPAVLQSSGGLADLVGTAESGSLSDFGATTGASVLKYTDQAGTTNAVPVNSSYYHVTSTAAPAYLKFTTTQVPQNLNCATTRFHFKVDSYTANESVSLFTAPNTAGSFNGLDIFMTSTSPNPTTLKWDLASGNSDTVLINLDQWYLLEAQMCYGTTTYTAQVWLDGADQGSISSTGQTASGVGYGQWGSAGNKTQTKDFDHIVFGVADEAAPVRYGAVTVSD